MPKGRGYGKTTAQKEREKRQKKVVSTPAAKTRGNLNVHTRRMLKIVEDDERRERR